MWITVHILALVQACIQKHNLYAVQSVCLRVFMCLPVASSFIVVCFLFFSFCVCFYVYCVLFNGPLWSDFK